jgi:DNA-binding transcriptional LysR family regulator
MEPFKLITSIDETMSDPFELLSTRPFVRFDSRSWVSQQIDTYLAEQKIFVQQALEVDSFEAVESLVGYNLGVSILPIRAVSDTSPRLRHIELMGKPLFRQVALVSRHSSARQSLVEKMTETLLRILAPNQ